MNRYKIMMITFMLILIVYSVSLASSKIPQNPDYFYFKRRMSFGLSVKYIIIDYKQEKCKVKVYSKSSTFDDNQNKLIEITSNINEFDINKNELKCFINILNYIDFLNLKPMNFKSLRHNEFYDLQYRLGKKRNKKFVSSNGIYQHSKYNDKNFIKFLFLNRYLDSLVYYRDNGRIKYWK